MTETNWLAELIAAYTKEQPRYDLYANQLHTVLQHISDGYAPLAIVQARTKTVPSFAEKSLNKRQADSQRTDPVHQFTDLASSLQRQRSFFTLGNRYPMQTWRRT